MFVRLNMPKMDLTQLATKSEIPVNLSDLNNDMNLITKNEVQDMLDSFVIPPNSDTTLFVPTKLSQLENDMGFLIQHQDISHLALKSELFSKSYNDLTDKPIIPSIEGLATQDSVNLLQGQINTLTLNYKDLLDRYKTLLEMINNLGNTYEQAIVGVSKVDQCIVGKKGE